MNKINSVNKKMIIIFIVLIVAIAFILHFANKKKEDKIKLVKDNSTFFTVSSCVSKYINEVSSKNTDNLLILLDSNYQKKYNIDASTIYDHVGNLNERNSFKAKKMYYEKVGKARYKYYVYGYLIDEFINEYNEEKDYYIIVYMNEKNMTFSIEPYDGEIFNS